MKLLPFHQKIAAPSPLVLSFLRSQVRNAFESPTARCSAAVKRQRRGFGSASRIASCSNGNMRQTGIVRASQGMVGSKSFTTTTPTPQWRNYDVRSQVPRATSNLALVPYEPRPSSDGVSLRSRRSLSTTSMREWFGGWMGKKRTPLPPSQSMLRDAIGDPTSSFEVLGRVTRSANELKMRCTELDEHGNVTMVSGEFKKSELIAKVRYATSQ